MIRRTLGQDWRQKARKLLNRLFPDRQIMVRTEGRVSHYRISQRAQVVSLAFVAGLGGWMAFTSVSYSLHGQVLAFKDEQIATARLAYRSLLGEVVEYQRKFTTITEDLEDNHGIMLGLVEQNATLQQNLKTVENQLQTTESERERVIAARESLRTQLREVEDRMRQLASHNFTLRDDLHTAETDLQDVVGERNRVQSESTRLQRQIKELESRLAEIEDGQEQTVQRFADQTGDAIDTLHRVVELTGLDVDRVIAAELAGAGGQGGPFIEADDSDEPQPAGRLKAGLATLDSRISHWEALQGVMQRMPLSAPLDSYQISSTYGKRRDPINEHWAMHYGLDLSSPLKSPVHATAPGVVTFAGWKGKYGKLVEVDHGAGIKTRYGHLDKVLVKKGQKVKFRDKVGLLGNTGRSTGAHLHYEVAFKGKTKNPMKFIKAGQYVFQE